MYTASTPYLVWYLTQPTILNANAAMLYFHAVSEQLGVSSSTRSLSSI